MDIAEWLQDLGLERYVPAFRDNGIDERVLPSLTAEDLAAHRGRSTARLLRSHAASFLRHRYTGRISGIEEWTGSGEQA